MGKKEKKKSKYIKPEVVKMLVDFKELVKFSTGACAVPLCCPYVFVWDGKEYVKENSILPESENLLREEKILTDYYVIQDIPIPKEDFLTFKIKEVASDISWFNKFSLLIVEHQAERNVGFSPEGELLSYKKPRLPLSCQDRLGRDLLSCVINRDWQNPARFYEGKKGDALELDFGKISEKDLKLVIVDPRGWPPPPEKTSIHIYILVNYHWQHIAVIHTRAEFYPDIIDLTPYLSQIKGNLKIKLEFTAQHKVSFVGLDTSPPIPMEKKVYQLSQAIHTEFGDVTDKLREESDQFVRLYPGEEIELKFPVPKPAKPGHKLSYVLVTRGYYIPTAKIVSLAKAEVVGEE